MRRLLTILCAMLLVFAFSSIALAANTHTSGLYTYEIKGNGTVTITDYNWEEIGWGPRPDELFIPGMIDGYMVTGIGDEAFMADEYYPCSLGHVTIPNSIKSIGEKAFFKTRVSSINIPDSVQHIGSAAFAGSNYCQFKVSPTQQYFATIDYGLYNKSKKELIAYGWAQTSDSRHRCEISIPEGIVSIGDYAFYNLGEDVGILDYTVVLTLPSSLNAIGNSAFYNAEFAAKDCKPQNIRNIGISAFENAHLLSGTLQFNSLENIGENSFANFDAKYGASVKISSSALKIIPDNAFSFLNLEMGKLKVDTLSIEKIGANNYGLSMCYVSLSNFSPKLTTIPTNFFKTYYFESSDLPFSELPDTITIIESEAFSIVEDFKLSTSLTSIAVDAFSKGSSFIVESGSYAELWCSENGFSYTIEGGNNLDWLNN